jgi:hypothetical protein
MEWIVEIWHIQLPKRFSSIVLYLFWRAILNYTNLLGKGKHPSQFPYFVLEIQNDSMQNNSIIISKVKIPMSLGIFWWLNLSGRFTDSASLRASETSSAICFIILFVNLRNRRWIIFFVSVFSICQDLPICTWQHPFICQRAKVFRFWIFPFTIIVSLGDT